MSVLSYLKPLRVTLWVFAIITIVFRPAPGAEAVYEGVMIIQTIIVPVLAPIFFMLLLLDSLMSTVWLTQTTGDEKKRYAINIVVNLSVVILLLYSWIPYITALGK